MTKVTIKDGESRGPAAQTLVGPQPVNITDARGRSITLKKPAVLAQFRMVEAMGPAAMNQAYMGMVLPLLFVTAIAGDPVAAPNTKLEVEALIQRLDEDGIQAVMAGVQEHFASSNEEMERKKSGE